MLKIENKGFEFGNCILRDPHFYREVVIKTNDDTKTDYEGYNFIDAMTYMVRSSIQRLDTAYKEVVLGGSVMSIAKGVNCVQRKFRAMVMSEIGHEMWYKDEKDFTLDRNEVMRNILNGKRFRHIFAKFYQSIDKKIMMAYIEDAYAMLNDTQKSCVDTLIRRKMRLMGNRCVFSVVANDDVSEIGIFVTPRVDLAVKHDSSDYAKVFPLVYNAVDHNLTMSAFKAREVYTDDLLMKDYESMEAIKELELNALTSSQYVAADYIICTLYGRTLKFLLNSYGL